MRIVAAEKSRIMAVLSRADGVGAFVERYDFAGELKKLVNAFGDQNTVVVQSVLRSLCVYMKAQEWSWDTFISSGVTRFLVQFIGTNVEQMGLRWSVMECLIIAANSDKVADAIAVSGVFKILTAVLGQDSNSNILAARLCSMLILDGHRLAQFLASPTFQMIKELLLQWSETASSEHAGEEVAFLEMLLLLISAVDMDPASVNNYVRLMLILIDARHVWLTGVMADIATVIARKGPRYLPCLGKSGLIACLARCMTLETERYFESLLTSISAFLITTREDPKDALFLARIMNLESIANYLIRHPSGGCASTALRVLSDIISLDSAGAVQLPFDRLFASIASVSNNMSFTEKHETLRFALHVARSRGITTVIDSGLIDLMLDLLACHDEEATLFAVQCLEMALHEGEKRGTDYSNIRNALTNISHVWIDSTNPELKESALKWHR